MTAIKWSYLALPPFHFCSGLLCLEDALINCQVYNSSLQVRDLGLHPLTLKRKRLNGPVPIIKLCTDNSQHQREGTA